MYSIYPLKTTFGLLPNRRRQPPLVSTQLFGSITKGSSHGLTPIQFWSANCLQSTVKNGERGRSLYILGHSQRSRGKRQQMWWRSRRDSPDGQRWDNRTLNQKSVFGLLQKSSIENSLKGERTSPLGRRGCSGRPGTRRTEDKWDGQSRVRVPTLYGSRKNRTPETWTEGRQVLVEGHRNTNGSSSSKKSSTEVGMEEPLSRNWWDTFSPRREE